MYFSLGIKKKTFLYESRVFTLIIQYALLIGNMVLLVVHVTM